MSDENKKQMKVKLHVVSFSNLLEMKVVSSKAIGVGNMNKNIQKENGQLNKNISSSVNDAAALERDGKESIV